VDDPASMINIQRQQDDTMVLENSGSTLTTNIPAMYVRNTESDYKMTSPRSSKRLS
jgi:hypothetical protein